MRPMALLNVLLLLLLAALPSAGQGPTASLVRDINAEMENPEPEEFPVNSGLAQLTSFAGKLFFVAASPGSGSEAWVSDGSPAGTELLADICPGSCSSYPLLLGGAGDSFLWLARDGQSRNRLWRSDGTRAGTFALTGPGDGLTVVRPGDLYNVRVPTLLSGGALYFIGCLDESGCEVWRSDGTREGTRMVKDIAPDPDDPFPSSLVAMGGKIYLMTSYYVPGTGTRTELWGTDGTEAGTFQIASFFQARKDSLVAADGRLFFFALADAGEELWSSDGTAAGTRAVTNLTPYEPFSEYARIHVAGGRAYVMALETELGEEIWRSDGTSEGTVPVTDFGFYEPFHGGSPLMEVLGDRIVFVATDGLHGDDLWTVTGASQTPRSLLRSVCDSCKPGWWLEPLGDRLVFSAGGPFESNNLLWSTDGTPAGTVQLARICEHCPTSNPFEIAFLGGAAFFVKYPTDWELSAELWRTDGTVAGTKRFAAPLRGDLPVAALGRETFFSGNDGVHGFELWASGPGGNRMVMNIASDEPSSSPRELAALGDQLFFSACDGSGREVWQTSGTPQTTSPLPGATSAWGCSGVAHRVTVAGGKAFFLRGSQSNELWVSDGGGGAVHLATFDHELRLLPLRGEVYFQAGSGFWKSDGTAQGTREAVVLPAGFDYYPPVALGDEIYFPARDHGAEGAQELWRSDGTTAGTRKVTSFGTSFNFSDDPEPVRAGRYVFFIARDQLWRTDGTPAGTAVVADPLGLLYRDPRKLTAVDGQLYFFAETEEYEKGLWRTSGSGATLVRTFDDWPELPTAFGQRLFFVIRDDDHGTELWTSDGTAAGTRLLRDIQPGPFSSRPTALTVIAGRLFFAADDGVHGMEIWQSDGTEAGTRMVLDLAPGSASSNPAEFTAAGERLYFSADDGIWGEELWWLPLTGETGCRPSPTHLCLNDGRFQVEAVWRDFQGNTGFGNAAGLTPDTGTFWFFAPENVEVIVKILDGRGLNEHFWVFYGALSNVEYMLTVTDTTTGVSRRYFNPLSQFASVGDTRGFGRLGAHSSKSAASIAPPASPPVAAERVDHAAATGSCQPAPTRLCLNDGRFAVEARWKDFAGHTGTGTAAGLTGDTGYFWFFGPDNVEVVLKVLDGRELNGKFWVFFGALSNVEYTLTVTDTVTGKVKTYTNPGGRFASLGDTQAF